MCTSELLLCCKLTSYLCRSLVRYAVTQHCSHWHTHIRARAPLDVVADEWVCVRAWMRTFVHRFFPLRVYVWAYVDSSNSRSSLMTTQQLIIIYLSSGGLLSLLTSLVRSFSFTHSLTHTQYLHNCLTETHMQIKNSTQISKNGGQVPLNCRISSHCKRGAYTWISGETHWIASKYNIKPFCKWRRHHRKQRTPLNRFVFVSMENRKKYIQFDFKPRFASHKLSLHWISTQ